MVPGPLVATQSPDIFWGVIVSMFVGNIILVVLNLPLVGAWVQVLRVPKTVLVPVLILVAAAGAFAEANRVFDLWVLLAAGAIGFLFRFVGLHLAPLILGLILGPLLENSLSAAMRVSDGDLSYLFTRPIAAAVWLVLAALLALVAYRAIRMRRATRKSGHDDTDGPPAGGAVATDPPSAPEAHASVR